MLFIDNLSASIDEKRILKRLHLEVGSGEFHVILGPNGAGKSTLGRALLGDPQVEVTSGNVEFFDQKNFQDLPTSERAKAGFFLSFQHPPAIDGVSAKEFLFAAKKSLDPDFASSFRFGKSLQKNLTSVHLKEEFIDREVNKGASGGERKKMEIASLLSLDPKLAFLDEIDSGLDIDAMKAIGSSLWDFMQTGDRSIVLVSHTDRFLREVAPTHVHVLCSGTIVKSGGPELIDQVHSEGYCPFMDMCKK